MRGVRKGRCFWLLVLFRLGFVALLVAGCGPNSSSFSSRFGDGVSARSADFFIRIEAAYRGSLPATVVDPYVENMRAAYVRIVDDYARSLDGEAVAERAVAAIHQEVGKESRPNASRLMDVAIDAMASTLDPRPAYRLP